MLERSIPGQPAAWGEVRPALGHNTTTPSPHYAARVLRGRSADTPLGEKRVGRLPRDSFKTTTTFRSPYKPACYGVCAVEYRPAAWLERARVGLQHNHAKSALRGACSVGPYSTGRIARGPRAKGFGPGGYDFSPTCRGGGAAEPRPTAWGGAYHANTPSPHCAAGVLHGRSADTPRGGKRAGRAPRNLNALITTF